MKIWFVNPGEPLPIDNNQRLFRTGKIAQRLKLKHEIIWFSSKFDHFKKEFRDQDQCESDGIKYYFIKSIGYKNNLSIRRVLDHIIISVNLFIKAFTLKKPDIVISSYPPIETSFLIMIYCKLRKIKFICDVRDLWPYTFPHLFKNKFKKFLCKIVIFPWVITAKIIFKHSQLTTISDGFLDWLVKYSKNTNVEKFYLSYEKKQTLKTKKFKDLEIKDDDFIISFVGNFSEIKFNFNFILDSSSEIYNLSKNIKFVFCGDFKNLDLRNKDLFKNIFFYDWIDRDELRELLNISNVGLAPYNDLWDFNLSIPNKISEYLSYELPLLTSLKGDTENLINQYNCGISYSSNDKNKFIQIIKNLYFDKEMYAKIKKGAIEASSKFYDDEVLRDMEKNILN
jgi:glycosyltransferase involved in cell wall biosynthesis